MALYASVNVDILKTNASEPNDPPSFYMLFPFPTLIEENFNVFDFNFFFGNDSYVQTSKASLNVSLKINDVSELNRKNIALFQL